MYSSIKDYCLSRIAKIIDYLDKTRAGYVTVLNI